MKRYLINENTMTNIADAIRSKTNETDPIAVPVMANKIGSIRVYTAPVLEGLTVTPNGSEIVKVPPTGVDGFGIVTVEGDQNLTPENIREGVSVYGVVGTHSDGLDTSDATATPGDLMENATAYVDGVKIVGTHVCAADPILEPLYVTPTGKEFVETPADGVDGFNEVLVEGDQYLTPENVKKGVTIYGVEGALEGEAELQSKEVTPTAAGLTVKPDDKYDGLSEVKILGDLNLIPENVKKDVAIFGVKGTLPTLDKPLVELTVTPKANKQTITPKEEQSGFSKVIVNGDADLVPENVVKGVNIFGVAGTVIRNGYVIVTSDISLDLGIIRDSTNAFIELNYEEEIT